MILFKKLPAIAVSSGEGKQSRSGMDKLVVGNTGACGCGKDHPVGGAALPQRRPAAVGTSGPRRRIFGYGRHGAGTGNHDFCQAGSAAGRRAGADAAGYSRPCGFFCRGGAHIAGAGLCGAGNQRHRRHPGPYPDALAAAGALWRAGVFVCQQDGSAGSGPGGSALPAAPAAVPRVCGLWVCSAGGGRRRVR